MKFREATINDVQIIVKIIADDDLGQKREQYQVPIPKAYLDAYKNISSDINQELIIVESDDNEVIGTMQLSFIQYLTYFGGIRAQIEAVRIRKDKRGLGIGKQMLEWAIARTKERNAHMLQLTTDKKRPDAIQFYENLGFKKTHEGMKLHFK